MKTQFCPIWFACLLCSCGNEMSSSTHPSNQSRDSKATSQPTCAGTSHSSCAVAYSPGDSVPPIEVLGEGKFSAQGLADAFLHATGCTMPDYVKPVEGTYKVWNEKDFGGRNRAGYGACFSVPPQKVEALADAIEHSWREKYGGNPEIEITRSVSDKSYGSPERTIHAGTIGLSLNEKYAPYSLLKFTVGLDPVSGNISVTSYRGTEDTPAEREAPDGN